MIYKMDNSYYVLKDMDPKLRKYGEAIVRIWYERALFSISSSSVTGMTTLPLSTITVLQVALPLMFITLPTPWISTEVMQLLSQEKSSQHQSLNLNTV